MVRRHAFGCVLQVQVPAGSMCSKRQLLWSILVWGVEEDHPPREDVARRDRAGADPRILPLASLTSCEERACCTGQRRDPFCSSSISPDLERFMAKRMGAKTIEVKSS